MRSVKEAELRELVKLSFEARGGRDGATGRLQVDEKLAYGGVIIPAKATVFFPKEGKKRSSERAIIYISDSGGSVVDMQPSRIEVKKRNGEVLQPRLTRSTRAESILASPLGSFY